MRTKMLMLAACAASLCVHSETVAWYRFDGASSGTAANGQSVELNAANPSKYPGYFRQWAKNGNAHPTISDGDSDYYPQYIDGFPSGANVFDPVGVSLSANPTALHIVSNGLDTVSGFFAVADDEELHLPSFTLEFFLRLPSGSTGYRKIATKGLYNDVNKQVLIVYVQNGKAIALFRRYTIDPGTSAKTYTTTTLIGTPTISDGLWHRVALAVDGETGSATLFVDDSSASAAFEGSVAYDYAGPLSFGAPADQTSGTWQGDIDEVRLSDRALSADELLSPKSHASAPSDATTDETLAFVDFEGSAEATTFDGFASAIRPAPFVEAVCNKAAWNASMSDESYILTTSKTVTPAFVATNDTEAATIRSGYAGLASDSNATSFFFSTNKVSGSGARPACLAVPDPNGYVFSDSATIEFSFKIMPGQIHSLNYGTAYISTRQGCYELKILNSNGRVFLTMGGVTFTISVRNYNNTYTQEAYNDGEWHDVAIVYDDAAKSGKFYLDGELRGSATGLAMAAQDLSKSQDLVFMGAHYSDEHRICNGFVDNVRISRGALLPYQLLTSTPVEGDCYARASFENNLVMTPYTNFFGEAGTASAFTASGSVPSYSADVPDRTITAGKHGATVVRNNRRSLSFDGGKAVWSQRSLLADTDEFTVEFFMKSSGAVADAGVMRVNRGSTTDVTSAVTWALSLADASGNLRLKVDTDEATSQTHDFASAFADGAWHHVGITFAVSGGDTVATLYKDAELVESWTADGTILTRPADMNFMIGAGEDATAGFVGLIDELRVTPGLVDPSDFLTPNPRGIAIIVR